MENKIGLVLSGGGVRGVAHVGVLKVLEEVGIKISHLSGASAGSIVGALYAAGHSPDTILEFFKKTSIFSISNYAIFKPGIIDTSKLIAVFKKYLEDDSYESLQKKLYIVATDIENAQSKIFSEGPVIQTILASSAFPMVFTPVNIDGILYSDGGIMNNFPIEPLEGVCDKIIGVYVNPIDTVKKNDLNSSLSIMQRAYHLSIGASSLRKYELFDVLIAPRGLSKYDTFSMSHIDEIYEIGYEAAQSHRSVLEKLLTESTP
ncbi:MAG TPA: patatin [Cytophagales bacterium]|mgnify:CR=1 FL=1|nr:patatin [Cytophagales bacterium]